MSNLIFKKTNTIAKVQKELVYWKQILEKAYEAELLKANLHLVKKGQEFIEVLNFFEEEQPLVKIVLAKQKNALENLETKFKLIKKAKRALPQIENRIAIINKEIEDLQALESSKTLEENKNQINIPKRFPRLCYKTFISSDNIEILVGKSDKDSDELTLKVAKGNYWWFHIKEKKGAHIVVKYSSDDLPTNTFIEAAMLAAHFSKGKNDLQPEITYTRVKYIRKPKNLKRGAVLIKNEKNILVIMDPDRLKSLFFEWKIKKSLNSYCIIFIPCN